MKRIGQLAIFILLPTLLFAQRNKDMASTTKIYNEEGKVQMEIAYNPACQCKTYTEFYRDGKVLAKRYFKITEHGEKVDGEDITYFRDGSIKAYRNWKDALPVGRFYFNHDDGSLEHEEFYEGQHKSGTWKYYDDFGHLIREQIYEPKTTLWNSKKDNAVYKYYRNGEIIKTEKLHNGLKSVDASQKIIATNTKPVSIQATDGKKLFELRCQACHSLDKTGYGPAVKDFGKKHTNEWLYRFIKDAQALADDGDKDAIAILKQWNNKKHPVQQMLDKDQVQAIIKYLKL